MNDLIKKLAEKNERLIELNRILIPWVAKFLNEERENNERENTIGCYRAHYILSKIKFDELRDEEILTRFAIKELKKEINAEKYKSSQEENPSRIHFIELFIKENYTYLEFMNIDNYSQLARDEELHSYLSKNGVMGTIEVIRIQITEIRRKKSW